jgi:hypothetical protein
MYVQIKIKIAISNKEGDEAQNHIQRRLEEGMAVVAVFCDGNWLGTTKKKRFLF